MRTLTITTAIATGLLATSATVATPLEDRTVEQLNFGTYWFGAEVTHDDLVGKVVLMEIWGS